MWRPDGREVFFVAPDGQLMAVEVEAGETFRRLGPPRPLFRVLLQSNRGRRFAASRDGQRFLVSVVQEPSAGGSMGVIVNWLPAVQR